MEVHGYIIPLPLTAHGSAAAAGYELYRPLPVCTRWLYRYTGLSVLNANVIYHNWQADISTPQRSWQDSIDGNESTSFANVEK